MVLSSKVQVLGCLWRCFFGGAIVELKTSIDAFSEFITGRKGSTTGLVRLRDPSFRLISDGIFFLLNLRKEEINDQTLSHCIELLFRQPATTSSPQPRVTYC